MRIFFACFFVIVGHKIVPAIMLTAIINVGKTFINSVFPDERLIIAIDAELRDAIPIVKDGPSVKARGTFSSFSL